MQEHHIVSKIMVKLKGEAKPGELMKVEVVIDRVTRKVSTKYTVRTSGGYMPSHIICDLEDIESMECSMSNVVTTLALRQP